ncbi:serine/threonine protein phosphatase [Minwuia thermotolerans]|uniref:Serine/threonine protein phosphatase n=2 Tax=Minwuia thermotolerans TaxID=2056226 RepID=A0A2M9FZZ5_9PROT|nr:serine/threonine protein phosphatase [Minwuia thermotolerans]
MLPWMKKSRAEQQATAATVACAPDGERIYAIGDVHGRADLLLELVEMIRADMDQGEVGRHTVVFLGDYLDRGSGNAEVLDILCADPFDGGARMVSLIGNHEAVLLQFLEDAEIGRDWLRFGGDATLASYGIRIRRSEPGIDELLRAQAALADNMPAEHLAFLRGLKLSYRAGDYLFVHAGIRPGVPLARQDGNDLIWIRNAFLQSDDDFGCVVVHGHTPNLEVESRHNRIGIDTGAYFSGRLTAAVLEGEERRFLST